MRCFIFIYITLLLFWYFTWEKTVTRLHSSCYSDHCFPLKIHKFTTPVPQNTHLTEAFIQKHLDIIIRRSRRRMSLWMCHLKTILNQINICVIINNSFNAKQTQNDRIYEYAWICKSIRNTPMGSCHPISHNYMHLITIICSSRTLECRFWWLEVFRLIGPKMLNMLCDITNWARL